MLLSTRTNRAASGNFAVAALASLFVFACGSDEANPAGVGGSAGAISGVSGSTSGAKAGSANGGATANQAGVGNSTEGGTVGQAGSATEVGGSVAEVGGSAGATSPSNGGRNNGNAGAGNGTVNCRGVGDRESCVEAGSGYVCDRTDSTADPRVCTCSGNPLTWDCVSVNAGVGGGGNGGSSGAAAGGAAGSGNLPACAGNVRDGNSCQAAANDCERNNGEVCSCEVPTGVAGGSNRREWTCQ